MSEETWTPLQFRIAADGVLWFDFVKSSWNEYSLCAVRFDSTDRPEAIRRRALQLPPVKPEDRRMAEHAEIAWSDSIRRTGSGWLPLFLTSAALMFSDRTQLQAI
jgi:hypothetical protein